MQAYFIHFFEKSARSEYEMNEFRQELQCMDFDEFHFRSSDKFDDETWKDKAVNEMGYSDIAIFLYPACLSHTDFKNVSYELELADSSHKLIFMVPMDKNGVFPDMSPFIISEQFKMNGVSKVLYNDISMIYCPKDYLFDYFKYISVSKDSTVDVRFATIHKLIQDIEGEYDIEIGNRDTLFNRIQSNSVLKEKFRQSILNSNNTEVESLNKQYEMMFNSIENLDERRQTNNTVYTTINTALIALIAASASLVITKIDSAVGIAVSILTFIMIPMVGILICRSWCRTIQRYKKLRTAKFETLDIVESMLPLNLNKVEWQILRSKNYVTTTDESVLPKYIMWIYGIFIVVGVVLVIISLLSISGVIAIDLS